MSVGRNYKFGILITVQDGCGNVKGKCEYYGICDTGRPRPECVCPQEGDCWGLGVRTQTVNIIFGSTE